MDIPFFLLLLVVLAIPLFFQSRRQKRRIDELRALQESLEPGDRIITTSGVHGEVVALQETTVDIAVAENMVMRWERSAILRKC